MEYYVNMVNLYNNAYFTEGYFKGYEMIKEGVGRKCDWAMHAWPWYDIIPICQLIGLICNAGILLLPCHLMA